MHQSCHQIHQGDCGHPVPARHRFPRRRGQEETSQRHAAPVTVDLGLGTGDADVVGGPAHTHVYDAAVGEDLSVWWATQVHLELARPQVQHVAERLRRVGEHFFDRRGSGHGRRRGGQHRHVGTLGPCPLAVASRSSGQLRDDNTDDQQGDRRLEVGSVADGEAFIGGRQEEVEPDGRGRGGHVAARASSPNCQTLDEGDKDESRPHVGEGRAKRHETGRRAWGGQKRGDQRPTSAMLSDTLSDVHRHPIFARASLSCRTSM